MTFMIRTAQEDEGCLPCPKAQKHTITLKQDMFGKKMVARTESYYTVEVENLVDLLKLSENNGVDIIVGKSWMRDNTRDIPEYQLTIYNGYIE